MLKNLFNSNDVLLSFLVLIICLAISFAQKPYQGNSNEIIYYPILKDNQVADYRQSVSMEVLFPDEEWATSYEQ